MVQRALMTVFFPLFVAGVIPTQKEKIWEGDILYKLWFVVDLAGSVYSAFCRCQGGADQKMQTLRWNFVWTWWFSFKSKRVCHLYVCILEPLVNTYTQTFPYIWNESFLKLWIIMMKSYDHYWTSMLLWKNELSLSVHLRAGTHWSHCWEAETKTT